MTGRKIPGSSSAEGTPAARRRRRLPGPGLLLGAGLLALSLLAAGVPAAGLEAASAPQPPAAPGWITASDTPNDAGASITVRWDLSPSDSAGGKSFTGYRILRSALPGSVPAPGVSFQPIQQVGPQTSEYVDTEGILDGRPYLYRVDAVRGAASAPSPTSAPAVASAQWFHRGRINTLVAVLVLSALIIYFIEHARRGRPIFIRKIAGLDAVDEAVGRATEMGRRILYIPGTADMDNVQTLAGLAILGRVARRTADYEASLEVPVSRSLVMVAGRETVKEAYLSSGRPDLYKDEMVYYLTDDQFGYAAALDGLMSREKPAAIFLQGSFYAESLVLAETGNSVGAVQIAGTAEASQLPFLVAACDYTLLGEELFLAGAYLSREPRQLGSVKGQDMGKAIILILLLAGILIQTTGWFDFAKLFVVQ